MALVDRVVENIIGTHKEETRKFVVQKCDMCNGTVELVSGDIIFGDKWYHSSCWESSRKTSTT